MEEEVKELEAMLSIVVAAIMNSAKFSDCQEIVRDTFELQRIDLEDDDDEDEEDEEEEAGV